VSYDHRLLVEEISLALYRNPCCSLESLSRDLQVSRRTIQKVVVATVGKSLRQLREEIVIARLRSLLMAKPTSAIKELSFAVGYRSPRSFARAIRRTCGTSPEQLRSRITGELIAMREEKTSELLVVKLPTSDEAA
jgi:AraC-like DNA-binding protein